MSEILYPSQQSPWSYILKDNGTTSEGTTSLTGPIGGLTVAGETPPTNPRTLDSDISDDANRITLTFSTLSSEATFELYTTPTEPFSTSEHQTLLMYIRSSYPPSFFEEYSLYLEDAQGNRRYYALKNEDVGAFKVRDTDIYTDDEDFNPSFISKVGYIISRPKENISNGFTLYLSELSLSELRKPTYCTPQDIIRFLGMLDNQGRPLLLTQESKPSYEDVCNHVVESEAFIDSQTRTSFKINREVGEIHDEPLGSNLSYGSGMFGIYRLGGAMPTMYGGQLFEGIPVSLVRQDIKPIDYSLGDLVEVRRLGDLWEAVEEHRLWWDAPKGIIYIRDYFHREDSSVRVTYRWGKDKVPSDITKCCKLLAGRAIISTEWYRASFPISPEVPLMKEETVYSWTWEIKDILKGYQTQISVGGV